MDNSHELFSQVPEDDQGQDSLLGRTFRLWRSGGSLGQQFARGSILVIISRVLLKGLLFIRTIILARLLFPSDFGLFSMAALTLSFIETLTVTGFSSAIIQEPGDVRKHLNAAWTVNVIRSLVLAVLLVFILAPLAGDFFNNPSVVPIAQFLAISLVVAGFENIGIVLLQKELRFNRQVAYDIGSTLFQVFVVIIAGLWLRNVWALVISIIAGKFAATVLSYLLHPFRPRFTLNLKGAQHLFSFGRWIMIGGIMMFLVSRLDRIIIGRLLNPESLGLYDVAFALGLLPATEIAGMLGELFFPLYAKIQQDRERMRRVFLQITRIIFSLIIPASVGLIILADSIVSVIYGSKWLGIIPILSVVVFYGILRSFDSMAQPVLLGIGQPKFPTLIRGLQFLLIFAIIIPLTRLYGIVGTAAASLFGLLIAEMVVYVRLKKEIQIKLVNLLNLFIPPVITSAFMWVGVLFFKSVFFVPQNMVQLLIAVGYGALVYFTFLFALDRISGRNFFRSVQWILSNI